MDLGEAIVFLEYGGGASHGYDGASVVSLVADYSALGTLCGVASFEVQGRKGWCWFGGGPVWMGSTCEIGPNQIGVVIH